MKKKVTHVNTYVALAAVAAVSALALTVVQAQTVESVVFSASRRSILDNLQPYNSTLPYGEKAVKNREHTR